MIEDLKEKASSSGLPWQTLLKEVLQLHFLEVLYGLSEASEITFQGGTCLRLLYSGPRHSEDLDFVTMQPLVRVQSLMGEVSSRLRSQEPAVDGKIELTAQKSFSKILRWKLKWTPLGGGEGAWVRAEFASFPAHTRELKPLPPRPGGAWLLIPAESKEEILTDKLTAFAGRPYLKGRDIFDLWFLNSQGVKIEAELLRTKFKDYDADPSGLLPRLRELNGETLRRDLSSFLPSAVRTRLEGENYASVLRAAQALIEKAAEELAR